LATGIEVARNLTIGIQNRLTRRFRVSSYKNAIIAEEKKVAKGEHGRAEEEHINETGVSEGAKRRGLSQRWVTCWLQFGEFIYICIYIYQYLGLYFTDRYVPYLHFLYCIHRQYHGFANKLLGSRRVFDGPMELDKYI